MHAGDPALRQPTSLDGRAHGAPVLARRVEVFATGGTIGSVPAGTGGPAEPRLPVAELLARLPAPHGVQVIPRDVASLPSPALTLPFLWEMAGEIERGRRQGRAEGWVVTQGTDTMEESAFFLDLLLPAGAPVVFTGAMRRPDLPGSDALANLSDSIALAASREAAGQGVLVCMNGAIFAASEVQKLHTSRPDAFGAPEWGPVGEVHEGRPRLRRQAPTLRAVAEVRAAAARAGLAEGAPPPAWPRVPLITATLDPDPGLLDAVLAHGPPGLVIAALGGGHLPPSWMPALRRARAAGLPVAVATRVLAGPLLRETYGYEGSEVELQSIGCLLIDLSAPKARLLLIAALAFGLPLSAAVL